MSFLPETQDPRTLTSPPALHLLAAGQEAQDLGRGLRPSCRPAWVTFLPEPRGVGRPRSPCCPRSRKAPAPCPGPRQGPGEGCPACLPEHSEGEDRVGVECGRAPRGRGRRVLRAVTPLAGPPASCGPEVGAGVRVGGGLAAPPAAPPESRCCGLRRPRVPGAWSRVSSTQRRREAGSGRVEWTLASHLEGTGLQRVHGLLSWCTSGGLDPQPCASAWRP